MSDEPPAVHRYRLLHCSAWMIAYHTEKRCDNASNEFPLSHEEEHLDERRASRIAVYREGHSEQSEEHLFDIQDWATERLLQLKWILVFKARVDRVTDLLETLVSLEQIRQLDDRKYAA